MEWREQISIDPAVCHGQACIRGTRTSVAVLDNLAAGVSTKEIVASYPPLRVEDARAATANAAELARAHRRDRPSRRGMRFKVDENLPRPDTARSHARRQAPPRQGKAERCRCRIDMSQALAALIASGGNATSISFLHGGMSGGALYVGLGETVALRGEARP